MKPSIPACMQMLPLRPLTATSPDCCSSLRSVYCDGQTLSETRIFLYMRQPMRDDDTR